MYKFKLKEIEVGDTDTKGGKKSTVTDVNPETGAITWDIKDVADFTSTYKELEKAKDFLSKLEKTGKSKDDPAIDKLADEIQELFNTFRTHIRKNYPEEYKRVLRLKESDRGLSWTTSPTQTGARGTIDTHTKLPKLKEKEFYEVGDIVEFPYGYSTHTGIIRDVDKRGDENDPYNWDYTVQMRGDEYEPGSRNYHNDEWNGKISYPAGHKVYGIPTKYLDESVNESVNYRDMAVKSANAWDGGEFLKYINDLNKKNVKIPKKYMKDLLDTIKYANKHKDEKGSDYHQTEAIDDFYDTLEILFKNGILTGKELNESFEDKKWSSYEQRMVNQIKAAQKEGRGMYTLPMKTQDFYRKHKDKFDESVNENALQGPETKDVYKVGDTIIYRDGNVAKSGTIEHRSQDRGNNSLKYYTKNDSDGKGYFVKHDNVVGINLEEESSTSQGGASFTPGSGAQYATPYAFKKKNKSNKSNNIYKYKLSSPFNKPVPKKIKGSGLEVKQLFEKEELTEYSDFQQKRINIFDEIENKINTITPLLSNSKNSTAEYYNENPGSYTIVYSTDMIDSLLDDIILLLKKEK